MTEMTHAMRSAADRVAHTRPHTHRAQSSAQADISYQPGWNVSLELCETHLRIS